MTAADTLEAWGVQRPSDVVDIARAANLKVEYAAVMLGKESSGGHNVWGRDGVPTGGAYAKGGAVTSTNYALYLDALRRGTAGRQGCGPTQLTHSSLQDQADRLGGTWRWEVNVRVGFLHLASLIRAYGERDGFRRYNGSGPRAEVYAAEAMTDLSTWRLRLGATGPAVPGSVVPGRTLTYGMRGDKTVADVQAFLARAFPRYAAGLPATGNYLDQTVGVVLEFQQRAGVRNGDGSDPDGRTIGTNTWAQLYAHGYPRKAAA